MTAEPEHRETLTIIDNRNGKSYEVPLQNFGDEEKKFIEDTRTALAAKK